LIKDLQAAAFLGECFQRQLRFILRGHKKDHLGEAEGNKRPVGRISGRRRSWGERQVWDARRRQWVQGGVVALPVTHPDSAQSLWLVVSRPGKGRPPWSLLTTEALNTEDDAWNIVFASARRGPLEMTWRFRTSELEASSPRLWKWEPRLKWVLLVSLV